MKHPDIFGALSVIPVAMATGVAWERQSIAAVSISQLGAMNSVVNDEWLRRDNIFPHSLMEELKWKLPTLETEQVRFSAEEKISDRLAQLKRYRAELVEGENSDNLQPASHESEMDLLAFLKESEARVAPMLTIKSVGNFRAMWKDALKQQVAIQFMGQGRLQYVCMALAKDGSGDRNVHYGTDTFSTFLKLVGAYELTGLLKG